ncbi:hypothetical protein O181_064732 [Austropuccinia psidii MF-1]|uniref:Uncharacterized protein n=1 Tax=Austropuccinia psidii MF-1 TaxID=1389203 RepID=A0A9Q3EW96_9BASI|nr:hypothetical protein [Austropuccinia psidii MF-1]
MRHLSTQEQMFIRSLQLFQQEELMFQLTPRKSSPLFQHHKMHILLMSESNSSPPLHAPTPGLNNLNQEVDFQTRNPPTLEETEQSPISQPASTPNGEFSIFSNEFCPQFYKMFQMFNSGQPTQSKYQTTFEAINSLVKWRLQYLGCEKPAQGNFDFNQCSSSYTKWINKLSDHS